MEVKFDVTPETAELIEELREDGDFDIDGMVSKLIPYGLFKDTEVDSADLYFEDVWFDFGLEEIEEIPLLEVYDAYADEEGEVFPDLPEGADSEDYREITVADIFFCAGAEPEDLRDLLKMADIPEYHSYDYIVPQEDLGEETDEEEPEDED